MSQGSRTVAAGAETERHLLPWVFAGCLAYWTFLALTSRMTIQYDAADYARLGRMLLDEGWSEYFRTGPNREPGYPLLIALAMLVGRILAVPFQHVQVVLQLCILLLSQVLVIRILRLLGVRETLTALTVLYLGISPAIVNSALSLFSEIVAFPLVLATVMLLHRGWHSLGGARARTVSAAAAAGLALAALTLCKSAFEIVIPLLCLAFVLLALAIRKPRAVGRVLLFVAVLGGVALAPPLGFRLANWNLNGNFVPSNRGDWLLYGSAARRAAPLSRDRLMTALATIPGDGVCRSIFDAERCSYWLFTTTDSLGHARRAELARGARTPHEVTGALLREAVVLIARHPLQFLLLGAVEGSKMFFWESTRLGFVSYAAGLESAFRWAPIRVGVRFLLALLTILAVVNLAVHTWRGRRAGLAAGAALPPIILAFLVVYIGAYSLFSVVTRYALPVAPLFLVAIGFLLESRIRCGRRRPT